MFSKNPQLASFTLMIIWRSGTIIATVLNWIFKFSGNSFLPAYPGFMVMNIPNSGQSSTISPSVNWNDFFFSFLLAKTTATCWAATDNTGSSIRLNSSKQPQEPDCAKPKEENERKERRIVFKSNIYPYRFYLDHDNPFGQNN